MPHPVKSGSTWYTDSIRPLNDHLPTMDPPIALRPMRNAINIRRHVSYAGKCLTGERSSLQANIATICYSSWIGVSRASPDLYIPADPCAFPSERERASK